MKESPTSLSTPTFQAHGDLCVIYHMQLIPKQKLILLSGSPGHTPYMQITSLADSQRSNKRDPYHKMLSTHVCFPRQLSVSRATCATINKIFFSKQYTTWIMVNHILTFHRTRCRKFFRQTLFLQNFILTNDNEITTERIVVLLLYNVFYYCNEIFCICNRVTTVLKRNTSHARSNKKIKYAR